MAVYDGFFDAVLDEETGEDDRAYHSGSFTDYFARMVGSGVCIHNDPDSFKVRFENGSAVISPGYLFIQGYWLKNDGDYSVPMTGSATMAVAAHLNLGKRMIEIEAVSVAQAYPDSLVLALVNPAAGTAEDTRHNTDICGVIDTAGELSKKVEWAIRYIDNEIEGKLAAAEAEIAAQGKRLDAKIAEVQAQVDRIVPPPVGTIKFSAAQDVGEEWLRCNGDFISESQYPELVAALGKLTPSADKFQLISDGEIGPQISNGVIYDGRMWVYSYATQKLYGVDLEGTEAVREIAVTSEDPYFKDFLPPSNNSPLCLSIVPHKIGSGAKIFLSQIKANKSMGESPVTASKLREAALIYQAEFQSDAQSLALSFAIQSSITLEKYEYSYVKTQAVPSITSNVVSGIEKYYVAIGGDIPKYWQYLVFDESAAEILKSSPGFITGDDHYLAAQRFSFSRKAKDNAVFCASLEYSPNDNRYYIVSAPNSTFSATGSGKISGRETPLPLNIVGAEKVLSAFDKNLFPWLSIIHNKGKAVTPNLQIPSAARIFVDAGAYLWGKDIYMIFVGTGIIFSRTLEEGSFGYLDTTGILGTITQFGYLDYSQDEGTLYLLGQDTSNRVKVAKIVLNTLYDYANDGAWLPMIASDGVPAYIKAKMEHTENPPVAPDEYFFNVTTSGGGNLGGGPSFTSVFSPTINGIALTSGRKVFKNPVVTFRMESKNGYENPYDSPLRFNMSVHYKDQSGDYKTDGILGITVAANGKIAAGTFDEASVDITPYNGLDITIYMTVNI